MQKILLAEDDQAITDSLCQYLAQEGFETVCASTKKDASAALGAGGICLVLLDIALYDGSGYQVCSLAKQAGIPVIFLTASSDENSVVTGLDMGADDYIAKPFRPRELISRIRSVLRRYSSNGSVSMAANLMIDTDKAQVYKVGGENNMEQVRLTALEYRLLITFLNNRGRLLSREKLLEDIWDIAGDFVNDNTLTVYIKRLREKIEDDPQDPVIIKTVRGLGYRMD